MKMYELEVDLVSKDGTEDQERQRRLEAYRNMLQDAVAKKEEEEDNGR